MSTTVINLWFTEVSVQLDLIPYRQSAILVILTNSVLYSCSKFEFNTDFRYVVLYYADLDVEVFHALNVGYIKLFVCAHLFILTWD